MSAPTVCTVTGVIRDLGGNLIQGATITAQNSKPFIHPTDNSLVAPYQQVATTDSNGAFSLALVETTTPVITISLVVTYPLGATAPNDSRIYTVMIPNSSSALFATLIGSEI